MLRNFPPFRFIIEWEVVELNIKKESYFIAFISILIINMLLIFLGVFSYFFDIKDYTLIAGIIAFFGAIIGGFITLVGVRITINENQKINFKNRIPEKVINAEKIRKLYNQMHGLYFLNDKEIEKVNPHLAKEKIIRLYKENDIDSIALSVSPEAYKDAKCVRDTIDLITLAYFQKIHNEEIELTEPEKYELKKELINDCDQIIYKASWNLKKEQEEYLKQYH